MDATFTTMANNISKIKSDVVVKMITKEISQGGSITIAFGKTFKNIPTVNIVLARTYDRAYDLTGTEYPIITNVTKTNCTFKMSKWATASFTYEIIISVCG